MDIIKDLVQTLIIIVVLAVFLEMLLPQGNMNPYVKMVMGLLIIIAVLHAISGLLQQNWLSSVPDVTAGSKANSPPVEEIIDNGKKIQSKNKDLALEKYRSGIACQVKSMAGLNPQIDVVDVKVLLDDSGGKARKINIKSIIMVVASKKHDHEDEAGSIPPVEINVGEPERACDTSPKITSETKKAAKKTAASIADFYNLSTDKVLIEYQVMEGGR
ncbi:MAG: stage III sporulation protein AF [Clostridiales bacterium]|nr:stage III sporulation protein AF [Clostridiales bacterium]MCF8021173.1 stage III sporulation protein AF [Clostridiales bacterium]